MNKLAFFFVFVLLIFSFVGVVRGDLDCIYSFESADNVHNDYISIYVPDPSAVAGSSAMYAIFQANTTGYVYSINAYLEKNPSGGSGTLYMAVYSLVGSAVSRTATIDTLLATANNSILLSSVTLGGQLETFTFSPEDLYVYSGSYYAVVIWKDGGSADNVYARWGVTIDYVSGAFYSGKFHNSAWDDPLNFRPTLQVYGFGYVVPTPTPTPAVTVAVYPQSDPFVAVPSYYMVLLVYFAVVAVLVGLYVTFEREQSNKGVALLFVLVGLILFVVLIVGYFVGF